MEVLNTWDVQVGTVTTCRTTKDSVYLPSRLPDARAMVLKRPERETAHNAVCNDVVKYERSYTSTLPYAFVTSC
jgi:hypothetical protein